MNKITYREMSRGEAPAVCELVRRVFDEFVAPDYGSDGIREFYEFANADAMSKRVASGGYVLVADRSDELVGMLEFAPPDRIAMLFVSLRRHGVARALLALAIRRALAATPPVSKLTVHSSPYAEPFYRSMGFDPVADMMTVNGITYIPMAIDLRSADLFAWNGFK